MPASPKLKNILYSDFYSTFILNPNIVKQYETYFLEEYL